MSGAVKKFFHDVFLFHFKVISYPFRGSLKYLTLYLLGIVFFAGVYMQCKECFYHSTVHMEPSVIKEREDVQKAINSELFNFGIEKGLYAAYVMNKTNVYEGNLIVRTILPPFNTWVGVTKITMPNSSPAIILQRELFFEKRYAIVSTLINKTPIINFMIRLNDQRHKKHLNKRKKSKLFNSLKPSNELEIGKENNIKFRVVLNSNISERVDLLHLTLSGKGQYAPNNFSRMFYFSAVTMTTLGYGDIVPLTNRMRYVVALQSIFGIVLLGLFLNSLATRIATRSN